MILKHGNLLKLKAFEIVGKLAQYTEANTVANANKDNFTKINN